MTTIREGRDDAVRAHLLRLIALAGEIEVEVDHFGEQMGVAPPVRAGPTQRMASARGLAAARTSAGLALFQHQTRAKSIREALAMAPARDPIARRLLELLDVIGPLAEAVQALVEAPR